MWGKVRGTDYTEWYEQNDHNLAGSGLWLRGGEVNTLPAEEWDRRPFRILIARLSSYTDTAESTTHKLLYALAKTIPGLFPDLAFLPPAQDARWFDRDGIPWLLGTNAKRGPADFDCVAFSNAVVQELMNLPTLLEKCNIPLEKSRRMSDPAVPLILLGGANALWTSVFWNDDPPLDGIFVGESIECIRSLFVRMVAGKHQGKTKKIILEELESIPGFFQPDRPRRTLKAVELDLSKKSFFPDQPVFCLEDQPGRASIEISEGCPCFCSFCSESYTRKPYRELPAKTVLERAGLIKAHMGLDRIELSSFNFNMHGEFYAILEGLTGLFDTVGLKSMRFDVLARDPAMLPCLLAAGKTNLTCGLEGISSRLRRYLQKDLSETDLEKSLDVLMRSPIREMKVFLIATGREEAEDIDQLKSLLTRLQAGLRTSRPRARIVFSATQLVCFPWTPLEFEDAPPADRMKASLMLIEKAVQEFGFEFRLASDIPEWWLSQVLVRASDSRLFTAIIRSIHRSGFVYRKHIPAEFVRLFREECEKEDLDFDSLLSGKRIGSAEKKPWEQIDTTVSRKFLIEQFQKCIVFKDSKSCYGVPEKEGDCLGCAACPDQAFQDRLTARRKREFAPVDRIREKRATLKRNEKTVLFHVSVSESVRGLPRKALGTALARASMLADPLFVEAFRRFRHSYWEERSSPAWITGDDVLAMVFRGDFFQDLTDLFVDPKVSERIHAEFERWGQFKGLIRNEPEHALVRVWSPFLFEGNRYLKTEWLKHILIKTSQNAYQYELTPESLRKNVLKNMTVEIHPDGTNTIQLTVGRKFNPAAFAKNAFKLTHPSDWVRIRMHSTFIKETASK